MCVHTEYASITTFIAKYLKPPVWTALTGHGPARIPLIVKEELQVPHAPFGSGNHPQVIKKPELQIITTLYNNQIITA
jgi:hypothetical protein